MLPLSQQIEQNQRRKRRKQANSQAKFASENKDGHFRLDTVLIHLVTMKLGKKHKFISITTTQLASEIKL